MKKKCIVSSNMFLQKNKFHMTDSNRIAAPVVSIWLLNSNASSKRNNNRNFRKQAVFPNNSPSL